MWSRHYLWNRRFANPKKISICGRFLLHFSNFNCLLKMVQTSDFCQPGRLFWNWESTFWWFITTKIDSEMLCHHPFWYLFQRLKSIIVCIFQLHTLHFIACFLLLLIVKLLTSHLSISFSHISHSSTYLLNKSMLLESKFTSLLSLNGRSKKLHSCGRF